MPDTWVDVPHPTDGGWKDIPNPAAPSALQRFGQAWWDSSVLHHPIDSAIGLVKSLVTFPDYHQLSQQEKDAVDEQVAKAFHDAAYPTPELAGQVASKGTNAAMLAGVTAGLAKGFGIASDAGVGGAIKAGVKAAAPDVTMGTAKAAAGSVAAELLPGGPLRYVAGAAPVYSGVRQITKGISKGFAAGKAALAAPAAAVAEATPAVADAAQADPELFDGLSKGIFGGKYSQLNEEQQATIRGYAAAPQRRAPAAASPATPAAATAPPVAREPSLPAPDQYAATDQDFMPSWEPGPPGTPAPAPRWEPYAEYQKPAEAAPAQNAAITEAQRIEDAADEHAARLQMQAEDIIWGNRARKADRFADYLTKNKLEPTPDNLAAAARAMSERAAPSDETVPMIHDRMGYQPPAPAIEDLPTGAHGPIAEHLRGNAPQAVQWLRDNETGEVPGALNNPDPRVGDIDLMWGTPGKEANAYKGGYGLAHILVKHREMQGQIGRLGDIISRLKVAAEERGGQELRLEDNRYRAIVSKVWQPKGESASAKTWLLTAFEPK